MKILALDAWERTQLAQWVNQLRSPGGLVWLRQSFKLLDILVLSEVEQKSINVRQHPFDKRQIIWNEHEPWELEFEDVLFAMLVQAIDFPDYWTNDPRTLPMLEKIEVANG